MAHAYESPGPALCGQFPMTERELAADPGIPNRACGTCTRIAEDQRPPRRQSIRTEAHGG